MKEVDIIILSNGKNGRLIDYTQQAVDSCHRSEAGIQFNIVVIEQNTHITHRRCNTVHLTEEFNYNRFMNKGIAMGKAEYVCLCNNDLLFQPQWCSKLLKAMDSEHLLSASPQCPRSQGVEFPAGPAIEYGYQIRRHISGWCIMVNRFLFEIIGKLDEEFPFWYADNAYAEQLKGHSIKHALVRSSLVIHLGHKTLKTHSNPEKDAMTNEWSEKFYAKYPVD